MHTCTSSTLPRECSSFFPKARPSHNTLPLFDCSTVGYGNTTPLTVAGKWLTILMCLTGIPFVIYMLSTVSELLYHTLGLLLARKKTNTADRQRRVRHAILLLWPGTPPPHPLPPPPLLQMPCTSIYADKLLVVLQCTGLPQLLAIGPLKVYREGKGGPILNLFTM
jgi:hypothetical protein